MQRNCTRCGTPFEAKRSTAKYCSPSCRSLTSQTRAKGGDVVQFPAATETVDLVPIGVQAAVEKQLRDAGKLETYAGQLALRLAGRIDHSTIDTGSAMASVSKELDRVMSALLADVRKEPDALDDIQAEVIQMRTARRRG